MLDAMIAIGLLVVANFLIMLSRQRKRRFFRFILSGAAVCALLPAFLFAVRALI
ncbi:DUF2768 family protein [Numidum massiliense]|uniref:DUF2768 family protein n=1 Tax=Numidum massiliense TaxID=1522315 RepID=UPI0011C7CEA2|nr:DUF2768 family protein [Numidum massiliense]